MMGLRVAFVVAVLGSLQAQEVTTAIEGRVVDLRGEPVPLAEVWVVNRQDAERPLARGRCDGDGMFRLGRVPQAKAYQVRATADGKNVAEWFTTDADPVLLRLHDAATLRGVLRNAHGEPVAGAVVRAMEISRCLNGADQVVATDGDGAFRIAKAPLGTMLLATAVPGEGLYEARPLVTGDAEVALVRVAGAATAMAIEAKGLPDPAPRVVVSLLPNGGYNRLPPPWQSPRLGADGTLALEDLPDTAYQVALRADGWSFAPDHARVEAGAGPHRLEFTAHRLGEEALACRALLRGPDGEPLAGVRLALRAANEGRRTEATSGEDGTLTFQSHKPQGASVIVVSLDPRWVLDQEKVDGMSGAHDHWLTNKHEWQVHPEQVLELRAVRACSIRGQVSTPDGRPAPFADVQLQQNTPNRHPEWMTFALATTDREGRYTFTGVHHLADEVRVAVEADQGFGTGERFALAAAGTEVAQPELRLAAPAIVEGIVRDADQRPAPGVRVWLRDWDFARGIQKSGSVIEVVTDREGRYRFRGVPGGGAWLQLVGAVEGPLERAVEPFEVETGRTYTFDLQRQAR